MALGQRPPTTSGIVVLSGSEMFGLAGDFPVIELIFDSIPEPPQLFLSSSPPAGAFPVIGGLLFDSPPEPPQVFLSSTPLSEDLPVVGGLIFDSVAEPPQVLAEVLRMPEDISITSTPVTTSGIVILDFYPGAGTAEVPWVPPVVLNARLFPLYQGPFPEHNRRIYPVLPQNSTLTPGD